MKKSVISDVFYGKIGNYQDIKPTEETKQLTDKIIECDELLRKNLSDELIVLYEKCISAIDEQNIEELRIHYVEGYKLGLLTGIEVCEE
jgi:hypothetical protein